MTERPDRSDEEGVMQWITGFFIVLAGTAFISWAALQYQLSQNLNVEPQTVGSIR